ncbi:unnamed protein product [Peniophora sp. CBMAI 1063]|nr:unnamed protein product [Peniophora sp. CBMAI 1063]
MPSAACGALWNGKVVSCSALLQCVSYAIQLPAVPLPEFAVSFTIVGCGICPRGAQANALFNGGLPKETTTELGLLDGAYGLGAFAAPLASTYFSSQDHWSYHYIITLGLAAINFVVLMAVFRLEGSGRGTPGSDEERTFSVRDGRSREQVWHLESTSHLPYL